VLATDKFDTKTMVSTTMGADAALDFDSVCSHAICSAPGVADQGGRANPIPAAQTTMYNSNTNYERFAGVVNTGNSGNDWASLAALGTANSKLSRAVHIGAMTRLKGVLGKPGIPMIGGKYVCLAAPEVIADMRQDSVWIQAAVFNNIKKIELFPWAEFELDGCVFVENSASFIENAATGVYGTYDTTGGSGGSIFANLYLGAEAFGVPKLSGNRAGSNPHSPSMIILDKADKLDPLNQILSMGWKAFYQAVLLLTNEASDTPHLVVQRTKATFA
jgi:N4-gp56 family major capsid protein